MGDRWTKALLIVVGFFMFAATRLEAQAPQLGESQRLVVVGVDGLDWQHLDRLVKAGQLPTFAALAAEGTLAPLATTEPAQSPVSWSSMITGLKPDRTGIDGFLRRRFTATDVEVELALADRSIDRSGMAGRTTRRWALALPGVIMLFGSVWILRRRRFFFGLFALAIAACCLYGLYLSETALPDGIPAATTSRQGKAWWEHLDGAGIETATILAPCSFPAAPLDSGRLLSGFGVPDLRGTPGFWSIYRDDVAKPSYTETGGRVIPLFLKDSESADGAFQPVTIEGPPNIVAGDGSVTTATLEFQLDRDTNVLRVGTGGGEQRVEMSLDEGGWSDPLALHFRMSSLAAAKGYVRLKALRLKDGVQVYADPVFFDAAAMPPNLPLSSPPEFAAELKTEVGIWETTGWASATNALKDGMIDRATFLEDAHRVWDEQEALAAYELGRRGPKVVTVVFSVPDRIQHMLAGDEDTSVIDEAYRRIDAFLARVRRDFSREGDLLIVASDHGFSPWRRSVNLNRLLRDQGWLVLKSRSASRNLHENLQSGKAFAEVDWSKTRAYSMGLGKIYLNRAGREPQGIVTEEEAPALLDEISAKLLGLRDEGRSVVVSLTRGAEVYRRGGIPNGPADLYVGFSRGYRVSWQTCLGGADEELIFDNDSAWSGDHCGVSPELVSGIIAANWPLKKEARVIDLAPTILDLFGCSPESSLDGISLLSR